MLKFFYAEESLNWLLLYAHSAGQAHTWADRHISSSHPNPTLGNLQCHVLCGNFHTSDRSLKTLFYFIPYLYINVTDLFHLVKACSTINIQLLGYSTNSHSLTAQHDQIWTWTMKRQELFQQCKCSTWIMHIIISLL